jgi:hypothetical protein
MEMAQALATRMEGGGSAVREKIRHGCQLLTLDEPPAHMVETLSHLYEQARADYQNDPANSKKLGATPEHAALCLVANTLLNLDAALTR